MQGTARGGHVLTAVVAACGLLWPAGAVAQPLSAPRVAIAAGGGISRSLHADLDGTAGALELIAGARLGRRIGVEIAIAATSYSESDERRDVNLQGPGGIIGRAGLVVNETTHTGRDVQINAISHVQTGWALLSFGGGVGVRALRREHAVTLSDCVSSVPSICAGGTTRTSTASAIVQAVAGLDVPIAPRLSAYGRFAFVVPTRDAGASGWRITAGARIAVLR